MSDESFYTNNVDEHELVEAYMALHPEWTTRGHSALPGEQGAVWIETWSGRMIASASYTGREPHLIEIGERVYARTFVAVSVGEAFARLAAA